MRTRLLELKKGLIETKKPVLELGTGLLSGVLLPDRKMALDVQVVSTNGVPMHLFFFSFNPRVHATQGLSIGRTGKFTVSVDTTGLRYFDRIKGEIHVIFNGGEKVLPYDFSVGFQKLAMPEKPFETLTDFANYAKAHAEDAKNIFSWKDFLLFPFMKNLHNYSLYELYYNPNEKDAGLTQFLKAAGIPVAKAQNPIPSQIIQPFPRKKSYDFSVEWNVEQRDKEILKLFLEYDALLKGVEGDKHAVMKNITRLYEANPNAALAALLYAYVCYNERNFAKGHLALQNVEESVQKSRFAEKGIYVLYIYIQSLFDDNESRSTMAKKLIQRYYVDGDNSTMVLYLEYRLNIAAKDVVEQKIFLENVFRRSHDGALFTQELAYLYRQNSAVFSSLSDLELRVALYGIRHRFITERKTFEFLAHDLRNPRYLALYMRLLKVAYHTFDNPEFLYAIVNVYLQQKKKGTDYFNWYRTAVDRNVVLANLFEFTYASLPEKFNERMPRKFVEYFGFHIDRLPGNSDPLYYNVLTYYKEDEEILNLYQNHFIANTLEKLKEDRYRPDDLMILEHVRRLYNLGKISFTEEEKAVLAKLKELYLVNVADAEAKNVVVFYPELTRESLFPIEKKQALIPIYTEQAVLAAENGEGIRFCSLSLLKSRVFLADDFQIHTPQGMRLLLNRIKDAENLFKKDAVRETDLFLVTDLIQDKMITGFYRVRLYELLMLLQESDSMAHVDCAEYLLEVDYPALTREFQQKMLHILIDRGYYKEAYGKIVAYDDPGLSREDLILLSENMIQFIPMERPEVLMAICFQLYQDGLDNPKITKFLIDYFEGSAKDLYILSVSMKKLKISCGPLLARAITASLYVNDIKSTDALMELYFTETMEDKDILPAYLVLKAHRYLKLNEKLSRTTQTYLKKDALKLPEVALLAALKLYAGEIPSIPGGEIGQVEKLLQSAAEKGLVLACFSKFDSLFDLPVEMQGRVYVEYHAEDAKSVYAIGQLLPQGHYFHRALKEVYPGIFVRSFVLYNREWMQYYYQVLKNDGSIEEVEAEICTRDNKKAYKNSLYEDVALLEQKILSEDTRETADFMKHLLLKERLIEEIFKDATS